MSEFSIRADDTARLMKSRLFDRFNVMAKIGIDQSHHADKVIAEICTAYVRLCAREPEQGDDEVLLNMERRLSEAFAKLAKKGLEGVSWETNAAVAATAEACTIISNYRDGPARFEKG